MSRLAIAAALTMTMVTAGCAARGPRAYIRVAEALASPNLSENIQLAVPRLDADVVRQGCRNVPHVTRIGTPSLGMQMRIGEQFGLNALRVVVVDNADVVVPGVPIAIEVEDQAPPVVRIATGDPDLARGALRPLNTGDFRLRVYTLCGAPGAEEVITVKVVPIPSPTEPPAFPGQITDVGK